MPQVIHSFRGENRNPRLKIPKGERDLVETAAGWCMALSNAVEGYHAELAQEARQCHTRLMRLHEIEEPFDLTKPF